MSLRKDEQGRWVIRYFEAGTRSSKYKQKTLPKGTTKREAEQTERKLLADRDRKRKRRERGFGFDDLTVAEAGRKRLEEKRAGKPGVLERYERSLEAHIIPALGSVPLSKLTEWDVLAYLDTRKAEAGVSDGTVRREWADFRSIVHWAQRRKVMVDFSVATVNEEVASKFKASSPRTAVLTPEQWRQFMGAFDEGPWNDHLTQQREARRFAKKERLGPKPGTFSQNAHRRRCAETLPVFRMLLHTGSRLSEVLALTWDAIDWKEETITIYQSKTTKAKVLPLSEGIRSVLAEVGPRRLGKSLLFHQRNGKPYTVDRIETVFRRGMEIIGARRELVPHSIRHTVATWLMKSGVSLEVREAILGHSVKAKAGGSMTVDYTHAGPEDLLPACNLISRIIENGFERAPEVAPSGMTDAEILTLIDRLQREVTSRSRLSETTGGNVQ